MSNNDVEVLFKNSDLSKYLCKNFEDDFETYEGCTESPSSGPVVKSLSENQRNAPNPIEEDVPGIVTISKHDHRMVFQLLQSKLLLLDDLEIIEGLFSKCIVKEGYRFMSLSTLAIASSSLFSIAGMYLKAPIVVSLSLTSLSAGLMIWESFKKAVEFRHEKLLSSYIINLQSLCYNIHSVLRFLKETEILSTGQVSTDNIGSAMYLPLSDLDLNVVPSWKILPHLRQSVYDSTTETVTILSEACAVVKDSLPSWLHITGFTLNTTQSNKEPTNGLNGEKYHTLKRLQELSKTYLEVQSELLKWIAFNLCPFVWTSSPNLFNIAKGNMFKIIQKTSSRLSVISSNLKLQFDMVQIFSYHNLNPYKSLQFSIVENKSIDLQNIQADLHKIFLSALLVLQKTKNLEDKMDTTTNLLADDTNLDFKRIKESLMDELSSVRSDLLKITQTYEEMYSSLISKDKASQKGHKDEKGEGNGSDSEDSVRKSLGKTKIVDGKSETRYNINSPDEVFLAISGARSENLESFNEDSWMERKPKVPKELLNELSTTLVPIKKEFQEREKLALERSGLTDIQDEALKETNLESTRQKSSKRKPSVERLERRSSDSSFSSTEDICPKNKASPSLLESSENIEDSTSHHRPIPVTVSSLAEALNTSSHSFLKLEEEFYSDDEEEN